jgi:hypothetical protein
MAPPASRLLVVALLGAVAILAAGCGGSSRPSGISVEFRRQATDTCARAVGAIGILDFTALPDDRALSRMAHALREAESRIRGASTPAETDRSVQSRLASGFAKAAAAVDGYRAGVRVSAPDDQRYSRMLAAIGDMGSEGQRAGTDACVVPTEA